MIAQADHISPIRGWRRTALAAAVGLTAAAAIPLMVGPSLFRATAVVSVSDPTSALRASSARAGAGLVVSKPVMMRAAASLIGTGFAAPAPDPAERLALTTGVPGAKATGAEGRLAQAIASSVKASGSDAGTIDISVVDPDAETAAKIATAVAEGFVADQDDAAGQARRQRELATNARIETLQGAVRTAARRFSSFAGAELDPAAARAAAAARTAAAVGRLDAIKAIVAANTPPLSDGKNLPAPLDKLQAAYLDQTAQLDKARETLGDRHTTVISLRDGVKIAAAALIAEWKRVRLAAEAEVTADRQHEEALHKAETPADATRQAQIVEARTALQRAQAALVQAQTAPTASSEDHPYRLVARAAVPLAATGLSDMLRVGGAILFGLLASIATIVVTGRHAPRRAVVREAAPRVEPTPVAKPRMAPAPRPRSFFEDDEAERFEPPAPRPVRPVVATVRPKPRVIVPVARAPEPGPFDAVLSRLGTIDPLYGPVPTIIVAANQTSIGTTEAALALATAAAESDYRVLLIEADRSRAELAAATDQDDEPVVIDVFGSLRVALRADDCDGPLYLAPAFRDGARIASALARSGEAAVVDDMADTFDLIVIDGGRAADIAASGWGADAAVRVGRSASAHDDARLVATLGCAPDALLGVVVGARFEEAHAPFVETAPLARSAPRAAMLAERHRPAPVVSADARRRPLARQRA